MSQQKEEQKNLLIEIMEADAKNGLYNEQTAVEWLELVYHSQQGYLSKKDTEQAKAIEKEQIIKAMMYALDEDGHTGEWKIKFVEKYYNETYNK